MGRTTRGKRNLIHFVKSFKTAACNKIINANCSSIANMKILLFYLLCLVTTCTYGQNDYTNFIACKKITWAADATDTLRFSDFNLSLYLREKLVAKKIKVSLPVDEFQLKHSVNADVGQIRQKVAPNRVAQMIDGEGNNTGEVMEADDPLFSEKYFDSLTNDILEANEILYIRNGRLLTYTPWLSVKYNVYTSWGEKLGIANAFNTAFKSSTKIRSSLKRKAIHVGQSKKRWTLTSGNIKMLKQLYEQNILEALWPHLNEKYYSFYDVENSARIDFKNINSSIINSQEIRVPVYDSLGNAGVQIVPFPPLSLLDFIEVEITQNWFFNKKKNQAYSKITNIVFYAKKWHNGVQDKLASPALNIVVE